MSSHTGPSGGGEGWLTVLRLPPGFEAVVGEGGDCVLDGVADGVGVLVVHLPGVAHKAVGLLLMDRLCRALLIIIIPLIITPCLYRDTVHYTVCSASIY